MYNLHHLNIFLCMYLRWGGSNSMELVQQTERPNTWNRYQRVSPDCIPLSNGRKPGLRTVKEDDHPENGRIPNFSGYDGRSPRVRSAAALNPSTSQDHHVPHFVLPSPDLSAHHHHENHPPAKALNHHDVNGNSPSRGGDVLLQWGHKKRSRGSRAESRAAGDEPSSSALARQAAEIQRRSSVPGVDKQAAAAIPPPGPGYSRGANLRPCSSARDHPVASAINRLGLIPSLTSVSHALHKQVDLCTKRQAVKLLFLLLNYLEEKHGAQRSRGRCSLSKTGGHHDHLRRSRQEVEQPNVTTELHRGGRCPEIPPHHPLVI